MKKLLFAIGILPVLCTSTFAQQDSVQRTDWFTEARFGMFIHWGLYSAAEGMWKGEKLRYVNNYAEWIRYRNRISKEEYGKLATRFDWNKIDPEKWVLLAKEAGMKYIIITAKHHDGVAIWNTRTGNYSLPKLSGTNRDVIKELANACRKHGMKLGFYYSHWIDWEHPYAWDHNQELTGRVTDAQYNQYWQEKVIPQLKELLTNYGDIAIMWFDMWIPYQKSIIKKEQLEQAAALIRTLQPGCLINSRLGLPANDKNIDFETLGDNQFGTVYTAHPWETPGTIAHSWGYNAQEHEWKSTIQLFNSLISNISINGDFTLNIGPRADGTVPHESITRLQDMGRWLKKNGEAIYGNTGLALQTNQHDWGKLTTKMVKGKQMVYAHVFNWPLDDTLRISGISSPPGSVVLWKDDGTKEKLSFVQTGPLIHITLPATQTNPFVSVIALEFPATVVLQKDIAAESSFGGFSLNSSNVMQKDMPVNRYDGLRPAHIILPAAKEISWQVYIPKAGRYTVDVSAHNPGKTAIPFTISEGAKKLEGNIVPGRKLVAEPNENNYTDEFPDMNAGSFQFTKPGIYEIRMQITGDKPLWLNRVWIDQQ